MQTAIVLGAANGIGAHIAKALCATHKVIGFHRKHEPDPILAPHLENHELTLIQADVGSSLDDVLHGVELVESVLCPEDRVDVFVHSLSGAALGGALDSSVKSVERTFNLLAHSFLWWVQALTESPVVSEKAHLIALTSPCPDFYLTNTGVIGAAKAALEAYVRMLAVELGSGYFVNALRLSTVMTPALRSVLSDEALGRLEQLHKHIVPAGRMMTGDDVGSFIAEHHIHDQWTNGALIDLTGGATLTLMDLAFYSSR